MATAEFSKFADILSAALSQNHLLGFEVAQQIDGETVETVADFIFLGSKIAADGDCSHEIKRCLLKNTQKNCTKKIFMTQIITMM